MQRAKGLEILGRLRRARSTSQAWWSKRAVFVCPHLNCERHGDKGFSRKENFNEQVMRFHGKIMITSEQSGTLGLGDASSGVNLLQTIDSHSWGVPSTICDPNSPSQLHTEPQQPQYVAEPAEMLEHRRVDAVLGSEIFRAAIMRLRIESADKNTSSRKMQMKEAQLKSRIQKLEKCLQHAGALRLCCRVMLIRMS